ncbi:uncharacterized protein B0H18DRAFT_1082483 [Fomitopsis serialis]|uniref:uncharacterized protein n=1 Tax=Fomitopsis serialis TaxID=139415 RepID=UPI0020072CF9|nr:uncharacterized protein B0H18DRAFT_1082483 [Neoantrodia serialis]KAH9934676.1 hypothetical protein B0H18DRAFT_1082483 [Neoantrodia serialis]
MSLFRPPNSKESPKKPVPLPPLTLGTPLLLFYTMLDLSEDWHRNKWWLFDRVVESPHRTSFFVRCLDKPVEKDILDMNEAAQYWYNGRATGPPDPFPPALEEACRIVEKVVNEEMHKRQRYPLEWAGEVDGDENRITDHVLWRANVAAANCYEGAKESVGPHSDQLTYLGPYPTIASLSLGTSRIFRLREVIPTDDKDERSARTFNIPLAHNSASNARINITFRFYRPDFRAQTTPRCKCGVPCILRADMKNRYAAPVPGRDDPEGNDVGDAGTHASDQGPAGSGRNMVAKYWWTCYAGAQNDGKGCGLWRVMDVKAEGRGPFVGPL